MLDCRHPHGRRILGRSRKRDRAEPDPGGQQDPRSSHGAPCSSRIRPRLVIPMPLPVKQQDGPQRQRVIGQHEHQGQPVDVEDRDGLEHPGLGVHRLRHEGMRVDGWDETADHLDGGRVDGSLQYEPPVAGPFMELADRGLGQDANGSHQHGDPKEEPRVLAESEQRGEEDGQPSADADGRCETGPPPGHKALPGHQHGNIGKKRQRPEAVGLESQDEQNSGQRAQCHPEADSSHARRWRGRLRLIHR